MVSFFLNGKEEKGLKFLNKWFDDFFTSQVYHVGVKLGEVIFTWLM